MTPRKLIINFKTRTFKSHSESRDMYQSHQTTSTNSPSQSAVPQGGHSVTCSNTCDSSSAESSESTPISMSVGWIKQNGSENTTPPTSILWESSCGYWSTWESEDVLDPTPEPTPEHDQAVCMSTAVLLHQAIPNAVGISYGYVSGNEFEHRLHPLTQSLFNDGLDATNSINSMSPIHSELDLVTGAMNHRDIQNLTNSVTEELSQCTTTGDDVNGINEQTYSDLETSPTMESTNDNDDGYSAECEESCKSGDDMSASDSDIEIQVGDRWVGSSTFLKNMESMKEEIRKKKRETLRHLKQNLGEQSEDDDETDFMVLNANKISKHEVCPLTLTKIKQPIRNMLCPHVYERSALKGYKQYLSSMNKSHQCPQGGCQALLVVSC